MTIGSVREVVLVATTLTLPTLVVTFSVAVTRWHSLHRRRRRPVGDGEGASHELLFVGWTDSAAALLGFATSRRD